MSTMTTSLETGRFIAAGGINTHFHEVGDGPPLLMLHGSGPGVSAWANWQRAILPLSETSRVLAPDIVGFGLTERPEDIRYSLRSWTDHVWAFLDAVGVDEVSIVGNSLGGRIALQMAEDDPSRLGRLILMGSPGVGMTLTPGLQALREYEPSHAAMDSLLKTYFAVDPSLITDELVRIRYEASAAPGAHESYRMMFFDPRHAGSELAITEEQVRAVQNPTLLVHGREDQVVPLEVSLNMLRLMPNADLHVFSRCGHWTQIERAAEFNAVVSDYLRAGRQA
jgi:pimeloyl-ACP methyl ester carboxylesterase